MNVNTYCNEAQQIMPRTQAFLLGESGGILALLIRIRRGPGFAMAVAVILCASALVGCGGGNAGTHTLSSFRVDSIGLLASGGYSFAYDLNDAGEVVGAITDSSTNSHAFSWTKTGGLTDLGTFGGLSAYAQSVDNAGDVAGMYTPTGAFVKQAWVSIGGGVVLPGVPTYIFNGAPTNYDAVTVSGMTNDGQVVMEAYILHGDLIPSRSFAYGGGQFSPIGGRDGSVVQLFSRAANTCYGYIGSLNGPPTDLWKWSGGASAPFDYQSIYLGILAPGGWVAGGANGEALGVLANGHAGFVSADGTTVTDLGRAGTVRALNGAGQAVGGYTDSTGHLKGFFWTRAAGFKDLTSMIDPTLGLTITVATGINAHSQIVCATKNPAVDSGLFGVAALLTPN